MAVNPRPDRYHAVTPHLIVAGVARAIEFANATLAAQETVRLAAPGRRVGHAELSIGDSIVMLADAFAGHPAMP